jgi:hypothetical protein
MKFAIPVRPVGLISVSTNKNPGRHMRQLKPFYNAAPTELEKETDENLYHNVAPNGAGRIIA